MVRVCDIYTVWELPSTCVYLPLGWPVWSVPVKPSAPRPNAYREVTQEAVTMCHVFEPNGSVGY